MVVDCQDTSRLILDASELQKTALSPLSGTGPLVIDAKEQILKDIDLFFLYWNTDMFDLN